MDPISLKELSFVLRATPFRERDQIVVLLTENRGKIHAIARNSVHSRRFGGCLNLFTASELELDTRSVRVSEATEEKLVGIRAANLRQNFEGIPKNFTKMSAASSMNELLIRTLPNHKNAPELFKLYSNSLLALNDEKSDSAIYGIMNAFILKLTQWLGVQPSITRCLNCEKTLAEVSGDHVYAQVAKAGWSCTHCESETRSNPLSKEVLFDAYQSILHPVRKVNFSAKEQDHLDLLDYLEQHLLYYVPGLERKPVSALGFLKSPKLLP